MVEKKCFQAKVCVVTGAASGIGFAVTEALLKMSATVVMADRDSQRLAESAGKLSAHAGRVHSMTVDVTDQSQVRQLIEEATSRHGSLDYLFNNAGLPFTMPIETATMEQWRRIIDVITEGCNLIDSKNYHKGVQFALS